jgi:hypothetical protein
MWNSSRTRVAAPRRLKNTGIDDTCTRADQVRRLKPAAHGSGATVTSSLATGRPRPEAAPLQFNVLPRTVPRARSYVRKGHQTMASREGFGNPSAPRRSSRRRHGGGQFSALRDEGRLVANLPLVVAIPVTALLKRKFCRRGGTHPRTARTAPPAPVSRRDPRAGNGARTSARTRPWCDRVSIPCSSQFS